MVPNECEIWTGAANVEQNTLCITCISVSLVHKLQVAYTIEIDGVSHTERWATYENMGIGLFCKTNSLANLMSRIAPQLCQNGTTSAMIVYGGHTPITYHLLCDKNITRDKIEEMLLNIEAEMMRLVYA